MRNIFLCSSHNIPYADVDECATGQHKCEQHCVNTDGSYECECDYPGYLLNDDGFRCDGMYVLNKNINLIKVLHS